MKDLYKYKLIQFFIMVALLMNNHLLFGGIIAEQTRWVIPDPQTTFHPGADNAPFSDPLTFVDESSFQRRVDSLIVQLASYNIWAYRAGYYATSNDPGKRVPAHAGCKLLLDSLDSDAIEIMNDDRSPKEHYHFAAVNWARFLPIFSDILTEETYNEFSERAGSYHNYVYPGGTENHKTMSFTSGLVLAHYTKIGALSDLSKEDALKTLKPLLKKYVKGLYSAGQGEWDSATYLIFDINGMLNIYDFSPDEECRLLAKAALDWFFSGYALKYTDGVYCGPIKRGFAKSAAQSKTDESGWLWWGTESGWFPKDMSYHYVTFHSLLTGYRPNQVICHIAKKQLPNLPFEQRNSKPNYWFGSNLTPTPHQFKESVYVTNHYTMGSIWEGYVADLTKFQLVVEGPRGGLVFTGGNPIRLNPWSDPPKYEVRIEEDGAGMYDQSCQVGPVYLSMSHIPDLDELHEEHQYSFFNLPTDTQAVSHPVLYHGWYFVQADSAFLALHPVVNDTNQIEYISQYVPRNQAYSTRRFYFYGKQVGYILQLGDMDTYGSIQDFMDEVTERCIVDTSEFSDQSKLTFTSLEGKRITLKYNMRQDHGDVWINGEAVDFSDWEIYEGPVLRQYNNSLHVSDGVNGFEIDFSGDLPVYRDVRGSAVNSYVDPAHSVQFALKQNYPNPFNPSTHIPFTIDRPAHVKIQIFNTRGQLVNILLDGNMNKGQHEIIWNGTDFQDQKLASGIYLVKMILNAKDVQVNRILLMK